MRQQNNSFLAVPARMIISGQVHPPLSHSPMAGRTGIYAERGGGGNATTHSSGLSQEDTVLDDGYTLHTMMYPNRWECEYFELFVEL